MKRQYYIDNLRWICIAALIPFHTAMAWNTWEGNYIFFHGNKILSSFVIMICPFYMPILFILAGMSMNFALKKKSNHQFILERMKKLFLPLISGLLTVVAYMAFMSDRFFNSYSGGFLKHYTVFFTHLSDFTGYDGKFTPGHLWFLLYLFIASMLMLLFVRLQQRLFPRITFSKLKMPQILLLYAFPVLFSFILNFGGKSIGECFALVFLGYYVFSDEMIIEKIKQYRYIFLVITILSSLIYVVVFVWMARHSSFICVICHETSEWFGILALLGIGKCALNIDNQFTRFMTKRSFPIYIFHFGWIVFLQYYLCKITSSVIVIYTGTVIGAYILTILTIEIIMRIPGIRFLFGIKSKKINNQKIRESL